MKKLGVSAVLISLVMYSSAYAVYKCVAYSSVYPCSSATAGSSSVQATCGGKSITVISMCHAAYGPSVGSVHFNTMPSATGEAKNCWCRRTNPGTGPFVFASGESSANMCNSGCANRCANILKLDTQKRVSLLDGVTF